MSQALAVKDLDDGDIQLAASTSLGSYYTLGRKITVRVSGNHRLCLTCNVSGNCPHIRRVDEFLRDNPQTEQ